MLNAVTITQKTSHACVFLKQIRQRWKRAVPSPPTCQKLSYRYAAERRTVMQSRVLKEGKSLKYRRSKRTLLKRWQGRAAAVGDLEPGLEVAVHVHETPLVLPLFPLLVVADLPWFVKCREPDDVSICASTSACGLTRNTRSSS